MYIHSFLHLSITFVELGSKFLLQSLKDLSPFIIKTICWISFIFGVLVDMDLKFYSIIATDKRGYPHIIFLISR